MRGVVKFGSWLEFVILRLEKERKVENVMWMRESLLIDVIIDFYNFIDL